MGPRRDDADEGLPSEVLLVPPPVRPRRVRRGAPHASTPHSGPAHGWVVADAEADEPTERAEPLPQAQDPEVLGDAAPLFDLVDDPHEPPSLVPSQVAPPMLYSDALAETPSWSTTPAERDSAYTVPLFGLAPPRVADPRTPPPESSRSSGAALWVVATVALLASLAVAAALLLW